MDLIIILTYTAICTVVFKVFKIPMNKWTVPTAALGGIGILATLLILMNYNHPYAKYGKEIFVSVPIVPNVTGTVKTVDVQANQPVKQGDLLFTIDPTPFQAKVDQLTAQLVDARSADLQNDQNLQTAIANVAQAQADRDRKNDNYQRYLQGKNNAGENSPFTEQELENRKKLFEAAESKLTAVKSEQQRVKLVAEAQIAGVNPKVAQLQAQLDKAMFDLSNTEIRAPSDGVATQVALRPGVRAASLPLRPVMTFIPKEKRRFAGLFWQNSLLRMEHGSEAEVIFDSVPGRVFKGKLVQLLPAMSEGEFQANGQLISAKKLAAHGFAVGIIELEDDLSEFNLPLGVQGKAVVINGNHDPLHVSLMRRILLRMMGWINYVYPIK
ncbi:HlyD family secretion protein [Thalassotalea aquiviva]|uniref:HlyD family secretion protein n=1 Tax=Thalassotalea aquiviva TaxID=3242415 RepID=UPI00352BC8EF